MWAQSSRPWPYKQICSPPAWPKTPFRAHLVVHSVQQPWDHREDCRAESLHVIREEADVPLEEANAPSVAVDDRLEGKDRKGGVIGTVTPSCHPELPKVLPYMEGTHDPITQTWMLHETLKNTI